MVGIYKITSPTGRIYIGQSWDMEERWKNYRNCHKGQKKIYRSIKRHGIELHKFEICHELPNDITQEVLDRYEFIYWELYKDCGIDMMNIRIPGSGPGRASEKSRKLMSINNWQSKHKGENSPYYGKKRRPEDIEKSVAKRRGENHCNFGKFGKLHPSSGKNHTEKWHEWRKTIQSKIINVETGEIYESMCKAGIAFGISGQLIRHYLTRTNTVKKLPIMYLEEYNKINNTNL